MPKSHVIKTSSSQVDLLQSCPRRWFFRYIQKLKEPQSNNTLLGDIGHGVCERWYDKEELYPEGWEQQKDRWKNTPTGNAINNQEQALVKALIEAGVSEGILTRLPDGEVEKELLFEALKYQDYTVKFNGFLDYFSATANHIQDHKFCKSFKWYGKAKLGRAVAMNAYGYAAYKEGWIPKDETVWLRYNLFQKNYQAPKVKAVEVEKTFEEVEQYWNSKIVPCMKDMVLYKKNAKTYIDVPKGENPRESCQAFGQLCPFFDICSGKETPNDYVRRTNGSVVENKKETYAETLKNMAKGQGESKMGSFIKGLEAKKAAANGTAAPATTTPAATPSPTPKPEAKPEAVATANAAPWYVEGCQCCSAEKVPGIVNGEPCQVCKFTGPEGHPKPDDYTIEVTEGGYVFNKIGEEPVAEPEPVKAVEEVKVATEEVEPVAEKKEEPEPELKEEEPAKPPVVDADRLTDDAMTRKEFAALYYSTDRLKFIVSYARVNSRKRMSKNLGEAGHIVRFGDFNRAVQKMIVDEMARAGYPVADFQSMDTWKRRDYIAQNASVWAEMLGSSILEAVDIQGGDEKTLLNAIEPFAVMVFGDK